MKILFVDLNETLIECLDHEDVFDWIENWRFKPKILSSLYAEFTIENYDKIVIYTNQAGIDDGYYLPSVIENEITKIANEVEIFFRLNKNERRDRDFFFRSAFEKPIVNVIIAPSVLSFFRKPGIKGMSIKHLIGKDETLNLNSLMIGDASGLLRKKYIMPKGHFVEFNREFTHARFENNWYNIEGSNDSDKPYIKTPDGYIYNIYVEKQDFSDSDKKFAENLGIKYLDIEDFIKKYHEDNA